MYRKNFVQQCTMYMCMYSEIYSMTTAERLDDSFRALIPYRICTKTIHSWPSHTLPKKRDEPQSSLSFTVWDGKTKNKNRTLGTEVRSKRTSASKFVQTKKKRTSSIFHFASQRASIISVRPLPTTKYHRYPPPLPNKHVRKKEEGIGVAPERNPF